MLAEVIYRWRKPCKTYETFDCGIYWAQAAQTLWEFIRLWIYKRKYENKQNTT